jgi:hypothetical protein
MAQSVCEAVYHKDISEAVKSTKTCTQCSHFNDFHEPNGRGWCELFDHQARANHQQTNDCITTSSKIALPNELIEVKLSKVKPTLRPKPQSSTDIERYRVVKTWDNGTTYLGSRVESVLIKPIDNSRKPHWESVIKSQQIQRNDVLKL